MTTHNGIIKDIAVAVSTIERDVVQKLVDNNDLVNAHLFQTVNSKMQALLGEEYVEYVDAFDSMSYQEREIFDAKSYWEYDDDEQRLANLEKAEAFILLSQLALTLKQMSRGDVISFRETFGQGQLQPATIEQIILLQEMYYSQAVNLVEGNIESVNSGMNVFVV